MKLGQVNKNLTIAVDKGTLPDFTAAKKALEDLVNADWKKIQKEQIYSDDWDTPWCMTKTEMLGRIEEQWDELEKDLKNPNYDDYAYQKGGSSTEDYYILFTTGGRGEDYSAYHMYFLAEALKYDTVYDAVKANKIETR